MLDAVERVESLLRECPEGQKLLPEERRVSNDYYNAANWGTGAAREEAVSHLFEVSLYAEEILRTLRQGVQAS